MNEQVPPSPSRRKVLRTTAGAAGAGLGIAAAGAPAAQAATESAATATTAAAKTETAAEAAPRRRGQTMAGVPFEGRSTVRVGIVGLGNRGNGMIGLFLALPWVRVVAVCDPVREKAERAAAKVVAAGQPAPAVYTKGEDDYENLCARSDLDFVYVATPWDQHFPMAKAAMLSTPRTPPPEPVAYDLGEEPFGRCAGW
ncbi:glycosyl hydrolase family 109 protein [Streptomyces narbonensis]